MGRTRRSYGRTEFSDWCLARRLEMGPKTTQADMDRFLGRSKSWGNWELGTTHPNSKARAALAAAFHVTPNDLARMCRRRVATPPTPQAANVAAHPPVERIDPNWDSAARAEEDFLVRLLMRRRERMGDLPLGSGS